MIGNDIVDLKAAARESNWKRKGFLEKIFTEKEREDISNSDGPGLSVWLFWSMKEAAYKANQRRFDLAPSYNPKSFSCRINFIDPTSASGEVLIKDFSYFTKTTIAPFFIHTVAKTSASEEIKTVILEDPGKAKNEFIRYVSELHKIPKEEIEIKKDQNSIPNLYLQGTLSPFVFSLSHHGNFSAYTSELRII